MITTVILTGNTKSDRITTNLGLQSGFVDTVSVVDAGAFPILDKIEEKQRGMGAVICSCPQPNLLRDNLLQLPVWYI